MIARSLLTSISVLPWAWLLALAGFVTAVAFKVGHFPSYSQPDPKHVDGLGALYLVTMVLMLLAFASPLVIASHVAWAKMRGGEAQLGRSALAVHAAGVALAAGIFFGDAFGLSSWLLD